MTLSNHVSLSITQDSVGVSRAGFGIPLILSHDLSLGWVERTRTYRSTAEVLVDFPSTTSPEFLSAVAFFSQNPKPEKIKIGRATTAPSLIYVITPVAVDNAAYEIQAAGDGVTAEKVSFTADGTATIAEITAGLLPLVNGVTGKNFTAVDNATDLTVTGDSLGDWFSLEMLDPALLNVEVTVADPGVVADLIAISLEDDDWYALDTNFNGNAYVLAADGYIATVKKIYVVSVSDSDSILTTAGNSDTLDDLATLNRGRTAGVYHPSPIAMNASAWMGVCLPRDPGSITWKFKTPVGVPAVVLSSTHRANLIARSANFLETVKGRDIMSEGTTADGDFIDVQRGLDFLDDDVASSVFENMAAGPKVPFTDPGVAVITNAVRAALRRSVKRTILAETPAPTVEAPRVADVSAANKTARTLPDVKFSATLAGAIHKSIITGSVSA